MPSAPALQVLIVDDERSVGEALTTMLGSEGLTCAFETDPARGLERAADARVLILDLKLPGVVGLELLEEMVRRHPRLPIVMLTAHGTVRAAVEAMRKGAFDFILKPSDRTELLAAIRKALWNAEAEAGLSELFFDLPREIVFRDQRTLALLEQLRRVAPTDLVVLLQGETGVGKEVFARLVHEWSPRADRPLVKINCAAIPETLFESELFGHEKGAFSGASVSKPGRVELADGGTLFLDEIGELCPAGQAKLLQFLQDHTFQRVGGLRTLRSDVRLVAATNRNLAQESADGHFREDLYFRVAGYELTIPPLRERPDDVEALAHHFLGRFATKMDRPLAFGDGVVSVLRGHAWPGNVRELEHALERAAALSTGSIVHDVDLLGSAASSRPPGDGTLRERRRDFERQCVIDALRGTDGNRTEAARALGISRRMLQLKIKEFGLAAE